MKEKNLTEKQKWCSEHKLTSEQVKRLILNKLERALEHLEARKRIPESVLAE